MNGKLQDKNFDFLFQAVLTLKTPEECSKFFDDLCTVPELKAMSQRLAVARALLHNTPIYIFDEATSNIDVESENDIMAEIHRLAKTKTVLLISHRLANVVRADNIYVLDGGNIAEHGSHEELLQNHGLYERLWNAQQALENYGKDGDTE